MLIFFSFALPIILAMVMLGVDFGAIFFERGKDQEILNNAALIGAKYLPYRTSAETAARSYAEQWGHYDPSELTVNTTNDTIQLTVNRPVGSSMLHPTKSAELKITVRSKAALAPRDALLFVDISSYMAPAIGEIWGIEERDGFYIGFKSTNDPNDIIHPPYPDPFSPAWSAAEWLKGLAPYSALDKFERTQRSQQCLNPVLQSFKQSAIRFYDYVSSFPLNSVGIIAGPVGAGVAGIKSIKQVGESGFNTGAEADFPTPANYGTVPNRICLGMAEYDGRTFESDQNYFKDMSKAGPYYLPHYSDDIDVGSLYGVSTPKPPHTDLVDPVSGSLNTALLNATLTARAAIWSLAANPGRRIGIQALFTKIADELIDNAQNRDSERGALAALTTRSAYIFLGDFPAIINAGTATELTATGDTVAQAIDDELTTLNQRAKSANKKLQLYLGVVRAHNQYQTTCPHQVCSDYLNQAAILDAVIQNSINTHHWKYLEVKLLVIADPTSLAHEVSAYLPTAENNIVLENL